MKTQTKSESEYFLKKDTLFQHQNKRPKVNIQLQS